MAEYTKNYCCFFTVPQIIHHGYMLVLIVLSSFYSPELIYMEREHCRQLEVLLKFYHYFLEMAAPTLGE